MGRIGAIMLGIWAVAIGVTTVFSLSFPGMVIIFALWLAVTGAVILLGR